MQRGGREGGREGGAFWDGIPRLRGLGEAVVRRHTKCGEGCRGRGKAKDSEGRRMHTLRLRGRPIRREIYGSKIKAFERWREQMLVLEPSFHDHCMPQLAVHHSCLSRLVRPLGGYCLHSLVVVPQLCFSIAPGGSAPAACAHGFLVGVGADGVPIGKAAAYCSNGAPAASGQAISGCRSEGVAKDSWGPGR